MFTFTRLTLSLVFLMFILQGCGRVNFASVGKISDDYIVSACYEESFVQPQSVKTKKVDILFVTDTSGSMDTERGRIVQQFENFVDQLPSDSDYRVAVMPGHGSTGSHFGKLVSTNNYPAVLSSQMGVAAVKAGLSEKFNNLPGDTDSDGGEMGLLSLKQGVTNQLSQNKSLGFFRSDAALATVFVADENDICAIYPAGVTPVTDPDGKEVTAKARDCNGFSFVDTLNSLKSFVGTQPLLVGGVIYSNLATVPNGGENEFGYGYADIIDAANGLSVDMASNNYATGLREIGDLVTTKLTLNLEFPVSHTDVIPPSVQVFVDGQEVPASFDSAVNEIQIGKDDAGQSGSDILVSYCTGRKK